MAAQTTLKDYVTSKDLDKFEGGLHKRIVNDFSGVIDLLIIRMDDRYNKVKARLDTLEQNFERLQSTFNTFFKAVG